MLYVNDWSFRFVEQAGKRGNDYDFEIQSNLGVPICVDAKCKIESTPISSDTVFNTLSSSRRQLPANRPGVFFLKVPQDWMEHPDFPEIMYLAVKRFFETGTGRVVSIVVYIEPVTWTEDGISQGHVFAEFINPRHRFQKDRDWRLLSRWVPPTDHWNKMPRKWARLIFVRKEGYIELP
jgi:hypothetical protein